jgi:apolipoprotein N-acyltransferase
VIPRFRGRRILLSLGAGAALALAFPDYNLPPFAWVSLAGLILASLGAGLAEAAGCGLLYGVAFYTLSLPWIYTVMREYGPLPVWQAGGAMSLLVLAASLFCAVFAVLLAWISRGSERLALLAAPCLWVALEFWRTHLPDIGFPWNLLGYTASPSIVLVQITSVTGIYGLSLLVAAYNVLVAWCVHSPRKAGPPAMRPAVVLLAATLALMVAVLFGGRFVPAAQPMHVAHLVQTNLPQSVSYPPDWDAIHAGDMAELQSMTIAAGQRQPGLVVWPEVPAPFSLQEKAFAERAVQIARGSQSGFLLGVVDWKPLPDHHFAPYNSAVLLDSAGRELFVYDKMHLVPFSEYVPWRRWLSFAQDVTAMIGDFSKGSRYAVGEISGGQFSVFICYEAIFPNQVRRFVQDGAGLLINISNDGWFGRSSARGQHLAMARVRAVENRRWLLRDTNTGLTAAVDPYGRIAARLAPDVRGALDAPYGFRSDTTPYTRWGDWVAWLSVIFSAALLLAAAFVAPAKRNRARNKK